MIPGVTIISEKDARIFHRISKGSHFKFIEVSVPGNDLDFAVIRAHREGKISLENV